MTSKEALERIKSKYKGCLVKEAHNLPFSSDINIENIEEYWHIENKNDFSQIEKDLEILEILKNNEISISYIEQSTSYDDYISKCDCFRNLSYIAEEEYTKLKEWLENGEFNEK